MTNIVLDAETARKLRDADQYLELRDPAGIVVGYFRPAVEQERSKRKEIPFTKEELDQFANEPGGRSLEEILHDLRGKS